MLKVTIGAETSQGQVTFAAVQVDNPHHGNQMA